MYFTPEREFVEQSISISQKQVDGKVEALAYKGNVIIVGRSSETSNPILAHLPPSTKSFCSAGRLASQVCLLTLGKGLAIPDLALAILGDAYSIHVNKPSW